MNSSSQACLFLIYGVFYYQYSFKMLKLGQRVNVGP